MAARQGGTLLKVHGQNFEKSRYLRCNFNSAEKNSNNDTKQNIALHGKTSMSSIHLSQCVTNDVGAIDLKLLNAELNSLYIHEWPVALLSNVGPSKFSEQFYLK